MKNYKIQPSLQYGWLGQEKKFIDFQVELLLSLGFSYDEFFSCYSKEYLAKTEQGGYASLKMCLYTNKEYLYFYDGRYFLPCEVTDNHKPILKLMYPDLKKIKDIGILK